MKENSKIFKILLRKSLSFFLSFSPWINKKIQLLQLQLLQLWLPALYVYAISKRIKLGQPARSHLKDLSQSFKTVMDFAMFFSLDDCETLTNILFRFFCAIVSLVSSYMAPAYSHATRFLYDMMKNREVLSFHAMLNHFFLLW